jgi:SAM-dependent methyltransferase
MSLEQLEDHRRIWKAKPVLADVYAVWFDALLGALGPSHRRVLELGAGPGFFSEYARRRRPDLVWTAADVVATPWNDLVADGLGLPFRRASFDAILAVDLVHHLGRPGKFFDEAARVLAPCGYLAVVEPWVTPLSYPIYRWLHQEGCTLGLDPWQPFGENGAKAPMDGDAAVVWRLVRDTADEEWRRRGFRPPRVTVLNGFAYLASLGFKPRSLLPRRLAPALLRVDAAARALAPLLGLRVHAVWARDAPA